MKQERRKAGGQDRDRDPEQRDQKREPVREPVIDEPVRRLDGPAIDDDSFRGKSDGEILQRYEL